MTKRILHVVRRLARHDAVTGTDAALLLIQGLWRVGGRPDVILAGDAVYYLAGDSLQELSTMAQQGIVLFYVAEDLLERRIARPAIPAASAVARPGLSAHFGLYAHVLFW